MHAYFSWKNQHLAVITDKPFSRKKTVETAFAYQSGYVNLSCEVEAQPPAQFIWYRHGKKISAKDFPIFNDTHVSFLNVYFSFLYNL